MVKSSIKQQNCQCNTCTLYTYCDSYIDGYRHLCGTWKLWSETKMKYIYVFCFVYIVGKDIGDKETATINI